MSSELIERLTNLRREMELRWTGQFVENAICSLDEAAATIAALQAELAEARNECLEQARLLGMSAERELDLQARLTEAREVPGKIAQWIKQPETVMNLMKEWHSRDGQGNLTDTTRENIGVALIYAVDAATAIEARDWSKK